MMSDPQKVQVLRKLVEDLRDDLVLKAMDDEFERPGKGCWDKLEPLLERIQKTLEAVT